MADVHIQMVIRHELVVEIDKWREKQPIRPSRTAAIHYMLEKGLDLVQPNPKKVKN